jgi:hypothetical protein
MLYTSPWSRFKLTTSVVIGTDCIGSCKSNYHTITTTTAPFIIRECNVTSLVYMLILIMFPRFCRDIFFFCPVNRFATKSCVAVPPTFKIGILQNIIVILRFAYTFDSFTGSCLFMGCSFIFVNIQL